MPQFMERLLAQRQGGHSPRHDGRRPPSRLNCVSASTSAIAACMAAAGRRARPVMALKFAELEWMRDQLAEYPLFLLDEVVAELDRGRRRFLLDRLDGQAQTLLTTTELEIFDPHFLERAQVYHVENGQIRQPDL